MLGPILCGQVSLAPLLPKLRGHFAEFLNNASPVGLRILSSSTCVGLRYGHIEIYSGFSWQTGAGTSLLLFAPRYAFGLLYGFSFTTPTSLVPVFSFPAFPSYLRPHSSVSMRYRNLHLLSIDYASQPRLRPRLTQSRSALLWNPWIFGLEDSHFHLATHSGILSSCLSTAPSGTASAFQECSSTNVFLHSTASVVCFSPGHFRRRTSRLVSYYALFECLAASKPTS